MYVQIGKIGIHTETLKSMTEKEAVELFSHISAFIVKMAWKKANGKQEKQAK
jgi:hypothetical protein